MRRSTCAVIVFLCSIITVAAAAHADASLPSEPLAPIEVVVPIPSGDPGDLIPTDVPRPTVYCCHLSAYIHCAATTAEVCAGGLAYATLSACQATCPGP